MGCFECKSLRGKLRVQGVRLFIGRAAWFPLAGLVAGPGEKSAFLLLGLGMQGSPLPVGVCEGSLFRPPSPL